MSKFSAPFKMGSGCAKSENLPKVDFDENIKIYQAWEKTDEDMSHLRRSLSIVQFGEELERVKILWFRASSDCLVPLLVREEDSLEFLERRILPEARNIYETRKKGIKVVQVSLLGEFTKENFYESIDENMVFKSTDLKYRQISFLSRLIF
jgi:hypothetical protein